MATRRPRIKVRPNLQRARIGNAPSADEQLQMCEVTSSPSDSKDERASGKGKTLSTSLEHSPKEVTCECTVDLAEVSEDKVTSVKPLEGVATTTGKSPVKNQFDVDVRDSDDGTDGKTVLNSSAISSPKVTQNNNEPCSTPQTMSKDETSSQGMPETGRRRPRLKVHPNVSLSVHKRSNEVDISESRASLESDLPDSSQQDSSVTDHSADISTSEPSITEEAMKSPTRRPRFIRAKPNIAEAERRHQRLSSLSETDDSGMPRKFSASSEKTTPARPGAELKSPDSQQNSELTANVEVTEKKKQTKTRRRQSVKLEKLVSENRRSFTISDLIHMNPVSNPMKRYLNKENKSNKVKADEEKLASPSSVTSKPNSPAPANNASEPAETSVIIDDDGDDDDDDAKHDSSDGKDTAVLPVPQVMLGPDGNIVLNDASLTIKNVDVEPDAAIMEGKVIVDNDNYDPSFYYKSRKRSLTWTIKETTKFYVALSCLGTDFSLMEKLFPNRNRGELKRKFKSEEKKHRALVDKALGERLSLDMSLFDASDDDDKADNGSVDDLENIAHTVKGVLENEIEEGKEKRRNSVKVREEGRNKHENTRAVTKKPKKKKSGWRSRYYESSDAESDDNIKAESDSENDQGSSDGESIALKHITGKKTRSGRQPKRAVPFMIPEEKVRKRRAPNHAALKSQSPPSSSSAAMQIDPELAPIICTPPVGTPHRMLEDTETGQRLLLVKSPPPFANSGQSEFVHVYLMSPRRNPADSANTSTPIQTSDDAEVFIPPPATSFHQSATNLQEEVITNELRLMDCSNMYEEVVQNMGQQPDYCNDQHESSTTPATGDGTSTFTAPNTPHITDFRMSMDVPCEASVGTSNEQIKEVMDVYENAEITTVTNDEGQIIEILIDPGLMKSDDPAGGGES